MPEHHHVHLGPFIDASSSLVWGQAEDGRWLPTSVIIGENGRQCRRIRQLTIRYRNSLAFLEWPQQLTYGPMHDSAPIPGRDDNTA